MSNDRPPPDTLPRPDGEPPDLSSRHRRPPLLPARSEVSLAAAARALEGGAIVAIPTDTVYGLAVLPRRAELDRLLAVKRRSASKGLQLLIDGLDQVEALTLVSSTAAALARHFWPGPLTLVLPLRPTAVVPAVLTPGRRTLGVRVPDHPVPRALARRLGPIAASSANLSGEADAQRVEDLLGSVGWAVELVLDDGPAPAGRPSTVIEVDSSGALTVHREAAIPADVIREALAELENGRGG